MEPINNDYRIELLEILIKKEIKKRIKKRIKVSIGVILILIAFAPICIIAVLMGQGIELLGAIIFVAAICIGTVLIATEIM